MNAWSTSLSTVITRLINYYVHIFISRNGLERRSFLGSSGLDKNSFAPPPSPIDAPPHAPKTTDLNDEELLFSTVKWVGKDDAAASWSPIDC